MNITPNVVLWIYVGLLVVGGLMGYLKAKSQVSLITSLVFAAALSLCALQIIAHPAVPYALLGLLLVVFIIRFAKTKKFMPSGMLMAVTLVTLVAYAALKMR